MLIWFQQLGMAILLWLLGLVDSGCNECPACRITEPHRSAVPEGADDVEIYL